MELSFYNVMYLIMHLFDIIIVAKMYSIFIGNDIKNKITLVISYALFYLTTSFAYLKFDIALLALAVNIVTLAIISINYRTTMSKRILCVVFSYIIFFTVETLVCAITGYYNYSFLEHGCYNNVLGQSLIKVCTFVVVIIISYLKSMKNNVKVHFSSWLATIFVPVATVYMEFTVLVQEDSTKFQACLSITIVLILNFVCLYMYNSLVAFYQSKMNEKLHEYEIEQMKNQNQIQLNHYKELDKKYQESQKVIHDIKKHLYTLRQLSDINSEKAENYCRLIEEGMDSLVIGFHCTNQIVSIVMSQKIAVAENENIKVNTDVEDLTLDFISDVDITAIFANLWDNAIDACVKVAEDKRKISFSMNQSCGFVMIRMKNSYNDKLLCKGGKYLSTKKNHKGVGLSIIKTAVEKYNGLVVTESDDDAFSVEITIPTPLK